MCVRAGIVSVVVLSVAAASGVASAQPGVAQGRVIAVSGRVEHTVAAREQWTAARLQQPLLAAERIRTLEASRASILFVDETQVKLNAGAVLTIRQVRTADGPASTLDLQRGQAWFRTKNPRSGLTIQTPAAAAAIRGTEIDVRVTDAGDTVLTVVEGAAEFSNPQGAILVSAGEEGTARPGAAPTKRTLLTPEDAVQWALYYPTRVAYQDFAALTEGRRVVAVDEGVARLRAGDVAGALERFARVPDDPWGRLGTSIAYLEAGQADRARAAIAEPFTDAAAEMERRGQLAAIDLATGDVAAAMASITTALTGDPGALRPLVLRSSIELRRNRTDAAWQTAQRAVSGHPQSVGALVAASEAAQSRFDLAAARAALDRALAIDPRDVRALVNRARLRFGTDDTRGASDDAATAAALAPDDAQVRSLRGFIRLAGGDLAAARADFEAAVQRDGELGEPHLGLGLLAFREGDPARGLDAMLTATLLEPTVSLYQSYLGKAYYQAGRFPEGLSALASAKRLDPRDPTPWLYASFFLRDQNQQVAALEELREAIARNDRRAVYRSRLLLDRDLATKNVSLAELYRQLGFEAWGASEALNSLETDLTNASAHLFVADTYGALPDRTEALSSELLQYFLYAPVNRNVFNSFSEYTALLEQPRRQLDVRTEAGSRTRGFAGLTHRAGNERFAHVAFLQAAREDGSRPDRGDDDVQGFFQGKLSLTPRSDLFFSYSGVRSREGASEVTTRIVGTDVFDAVILRQFILDPDPTLTSDFRSHEVTLGGKHQWHAGSAFTAVARYQALEQTDIAPAATISCEGLDLTAFPPFQGLDARADRRTRSPMDVLELQVQQATRLGRHQVIVGQQFYTLDKASRCEETIRFAAFDETFDNQASSDGHDSGAHTYVRDEFQVTRRLHVSFGVGYQQVSYAEPGFGATSVIEAGQWSPRAGLAVQLTPGTWLRAAAFRQLGTNLLASSIAPPTVAGFVLARNELPTAERNEYSLSIEHAARRMFWAARGFRRDAKVPYLLALGSFLPEADAESTGGSLHLNWILGRHVTLFAADQALRFDTSRFVRVDNAARVGVNVIHPRGVFARVSGGYVTQRFSNTTLQGLPRSSFTPVDVRVAYEFAGKRGLASLDISNALGERFESVIENLSVDRLLPRRRVVAALRWRLW